MISGIGTDIVQIARIKDVLERRGRFFAVRILCPSEIAIFDNKKQPEAYLAKRYAAKEAASKALGTGIGTISWQDIEVSNDSAGAPLLTLTGAAHARMVEMGASKVLVSLSDERDFVVAFVTLSCD
ncbi:MAG: holo-ACP synthase [Porticoccus sp.]|nr:holo-ACP synthase [Porticoccus sp.]